MKWRRRRFQRARKKAREAAKRWPWRRSRREVTAATGEALQQDFLEARLDAQNDPRQGPIYES
jgi:hypothetical protein